MPPVLKLPLIGLNWTLLSTRRMAGKGWKKGKVLMKCGRKMAMTLCAIQIYMQAP
jgi:hypothetical protein